MKTEDVLRLFPTTRPMFGVELGATLNNLYVVPESAMRDVPEAPYLLTVGLTQPRQPFSGFTAEVLQTWAPELKESPLIRLWDRVFPNLTIEKPPFPILPSLDMFQAIGEDNHWVWWGHNRSVFLGVGQKGGLQQLSYSAPQGNYKLHGKWRRSSVAGVLLGSGWIAECPRCGPNCLRPDHWRERPGGRPGRPRGPGVTNDDLWIPTGVKTEN